MNEPPPKMDTFIRVGIDFLLSYIKDESLPQSSLDQFASELELAVTAKFDGHWYPQQPSKGSAYRCIVINGKLHPLLEQAAKKVGVSTQIIAKHFPSKLYLWIDPDEVSYRINDQRAVKTLFSAPITTPMQYNAYNQSNEYKMMEQQLKNGLTVNDSFTPAQGSGDSPKGFYTRNSLWIPTTGSTSMGFSQSYTMASGQPQYYESGLSRAELSDNFMEPVQGSPMHHNHYQQYQQHHQQNNNLDYSQAGPNRNNSQMNHFPQYEVVVN